MKQLRVVLVTIFALFFICALSACQSNTLGQKSPAPNKNNTSPLKDWYSVDNIETLNQWVMKANKNVMPNTPDQEITESDVESYGDISHIIDNVSESGYLLFCTEEGEPLEISMCDLYDSNRIHDMFLRFEYEYNGKAYGLPCFITYIPQEDLELARISPVECIKKVGGVELYSADNPLKYGNYTVISREQTIVIGDTSMQAIAMEYESPEMERKSGVTYFVYNDMIVQMMARYSDEEISEMLKTVFLDNYYINQA